MDHSLLARRRDAFHEAGHVVVAWALGLRVGRVWLSESGEHRGRAEIECSCNLPAVDQIAVCMSGAFGAELSGVNQVDSLEDIGDECKALAIQKRAFPDDDQAQKKLWRQGCERAQDLLKSREHLVSRVARELERTGELWPDEVVRLLSR